MLSHYLRRNRERPCAAFLLRFLWHAVSAFRSRFLHLFAPCIFLRSVWVSHFPKCTRPPCFTYGRVLRSRFVLALLFAFLHFARSLVTFPSCLRSRMLARPLSPFSRVPFGCPTGGCVVFFSLSLRRFGLAMCPALRPFFWRVRVPFHWCVSIVSHYWARWCSI